MLGFALCALTGALFVGGIGANIIGDNAYDIILRDGWLELKLLFIALAGVNLGLYYLTGMSRAVDAVDADGNAPALAKVFAATSLCLWIGIIVFGRLIPQGL